MTRKRKSGATLETTPKTQAELSVIIPSVNSYDDLEGCLRALRTEQGATLEIIVVDRLGEHVRHFVRREHPTVTVIAVAGETTIPQMRALGIRRANCPATAMIEDHVIVPQGWARALLDALSGEGDQVGAVGGPVDNAATHGRIDWAAFLCEYSSTLPPLPAGHADWLPGNNVIYPTAVLRRHDAVLDCNAWEGALHDAIRDGGNPLVMRPEIVVGHKMHYTIGLYTSQRYLYSRSYAGARAAGMPLAKRLVAGGAALIVLPPLMFLRTVVRVRGKPPYNAHLVPSLPILVPFCISWGLGEAVGFWFGSGGALAKVR
tara:strand:+ start:38160 stop:39110 length:951 start_codon:yes stop_codon:yes gene_type:complete